MSLDFPQPVGHYSQVVHAGDLLFLSGQISIDPKTNEVKLFDGDVGRQTELVLQNIGAILQSQKLNKNSVVKTTIYLTDLSKFTQVNEVYAKFFGDHKPARSTVGVAALPKGVAVEIEIIARG